MRRHAEDVVREGESSSPSGEIGDDLFRFAIVGADLHLQRRCVEGHAEFGQLTRDRALARLALHEVGDGRRFFPEIIVEGPRGGRSGHTNSLDPRLRCGDGQRE